MSNEAINWAFRQKVPSTEKFVLVVLADYADEEGSCFPGQKRIAEKVGGSERTVRRSLKSLEARGLIRRERRSRGDGSRSSDRYVLPVNMPTGHFDHWPESAPPTGQIGGDYEPLVNPLPEEAERPPQEQLEKVVQAAAKSAYDAIGKASNFMALRGVAKWALTERELNPEQFTLVVKSLYRMGKPITRQTVGQIIDGHIKAPALANAGLSESEERDRRLNPWKYQ